MNHLDVVRHFDFDWAVSLSDVWSDAAWDVPALHGPTRQQFIERLEAIHKPGQAKSPLGWVLIGRGGSGKTHLLSRFRHEAKHRKAAFVLVDMTDVRDFWETVLQGYLDSLQQKYDGDLFQHQCLVRNLIQRAGPNKPVAEILSILSRRKSADLAGDMNKVLSVLFKAYPAPTSKYQDIVRALICLNSEDFSISNLGMTWLQGQDIDETDKRTLGFTASCKKPIELVEALSWFTSLGGPTVLAFDQLDAIVTEHNAAKRSETDAEEQSASWSIILQIGAGLGAVRDKTCNTLTVVACLESTWATLNEVVPPAFLARFDLPPQRLDSIKDQTVAEGLVRNRLALAFAECDFTPPYPTWPFRPQALASLSTNTPREVLQLCELHRKTWLKSGQISEVRQLGEGVVPNGPSLPTDKFKQLDQRFEMLRSEADIPNFLEEKREDERLAPLLQTALQCLRHEASLPPHVVATVEKEFTGGDKTRPLHVRLRLIFQNENEREEHFCLRAVQLTNARAYQARLKAAMTQSGIDRALRFRRLGIVRTTSLPGGAETQKLTERFQNAGGLFLKPSDDELRTLSAVHLLRQAGEPDFEAWLKSRRPISKLGLIREAVPNPLLLDDVSVAKEAGCSHPTPSTKEAEEIERTPEHALFPLGRRLGGGKVGDPVTMPVRLLEKHSVVLAGAGSGKTVLLRRLVEEAVLLGIPSIVIDCANDLATLGEAWPTRPSEWGPEDEDRARRYHECGEVVIWTPGKEGGNPLAFEPLPDLAALSHDEDDLESAITMVRESLDPALCR
jgi:GTPase SAR1 family protein